MPKARKYQTKKELSNPIQEAVHTIRSTRSKAAAQKATMKYLKANTYGTHTKELEVLKSLNIMSGKNSPLAYVKGTGANGTYEVSKVNRLQIWQSC